MAKVLFTAIVADMRNKLNGTVFSKNRAGAYVRTKVTPINAQTSFQMAVRQRLASFASQWRGLTDAQIAAWNAATADFPRTDIFGNQRFLTGLQLYTSLNSNIVNVAGTPIDNPPSPEAIPEIAIVSLAGDASSQTLTLIMSDAIPADYALVIQATAPVSPGKAFLKNAYRQIQVEQTGIASTFNLETEYIAKFGALTGTAGKRIGVRVYYINTVTGQAGLPVNISDIVAP